MKKIAFADEFGNNSFDFETQGSHFIIASVITNNNNLSTFQNQLEVIRKRYFQTGEIKSSKVKGNHARRIKILHEINSIEFAIYAVVVDKRKLYSDGFKYKRSFYKALNGVLYKELYRTFPQLELTVDEHGGNDFLRSFKKYVEKNHIRSLFEGSDFIIQNSRDNIGIQLADFIAGTLGYIFDKQKKSEQSQVFLDLIKNKLTSIHEYPSNYNANELIKSDAYNEFDQTIANLSIMRITDFIDKNTGDNQISIDRISFAKLLLLHYQSNPPGRYTTADEFIKHLNVNRDTPLSKEQFSNKIIGYLRDKGLLIASSRDGYKIPTSVNDMKKFINHGNKIIFPVLRRIKECRIAILLATTNKYDILNEVEFNNLKKLIENIS